MGSVLRAPPPSPSRLPAAAAIFENVNFFVYFSSVRGARLFIRDTTAGVCITSDQSSRLSVHLSVILPICASAGLCSPPVRRPPPTPPTSLPLPRSALATAVDVAVPTWAQGTCQTGARPPAGR